jgi:surface polysaccharide O-acyltransferase-like enzyme
VKKYKSYDITADIVRLIGALAVVSIHVTDALVMLPNHFGGLSWWWADFLNSISRIAVPFFIMLSGYLFLNPEKKIDKISFYKKRVLRVVLPFIFWFFFYLFWNQYHNRVRYTLPIIIENLFMLSFGHLYFLVIIFLLYLMTPRIKKYTDNISTLKLKITILKILTIASLTILATYIFPFLTILRSIITVPFFFLGYYLFGILARKIKLIKKTTFLLMLIFFVLGIATTVLVYINTKYKIIWADNIGQYFHESFSPLVIIMSLSLFATILSLKNIIVKKVERWGRFIKNLATDTFIIYLIHPLIIDLVNTYLHMNIHEMHSVLWLWISIKIIIVFIISALIAKFYHLLLSLINTVRIK